MPLQSVLLVLAVLCCCSCGDSRGTGGIQISEHGASFDTAAAAKRKAERTIVEAIADEVSVTWRVGADIAEPPDWDATKEEWRWNQVTVTVTLAGSGTEPDEAEIRRAVSDYLAQHQRAGAPVPAVTVHIERQGAVVAIPTPRFTPTEGWRYTIKAGDTLAQLSSVFYGTPEHWRRILDANPGKTPESLVVGEVILIPPAP